MSAWERLKTAADAARATRIARMFEAEGPARLERLTLDAAGLYLDITKQAWTLEGLEAALALIREADVEGRRARLFAGDVVNRSEDRAVMHPALRAPDGAAFATRGEPVSGEVEQGRAAMRAFL